MTNLNELNARKRAILDEARRRPRHIWDEDERQTVFARAADYLLKEGIGHLPSGDDRTGSKLLVTAFRLAQEALPPNRRKSASSAGRSAFGARKFWGRFEQFLAEAGAGRRKAALIAERDKPPAAPEPPPAPPPPAAPAAKAPEPARPPQLAGIGADMLEDFPTENLIAIIAARFFGFLDAKAPPAEIARVERKTEDALEMQRLLLEELEAVKNQVRSLTLTIKTLTPAANVPSLAERKHPPRVAVIGCNSDQFKAVVEKLAGVQVELRHYDVNTRPVNVRADYAVAMRFLWHSWSDRAKECVPDGHFAFVRGGPQQVAEKILEWVPPVSPMVS